MPQTIDGIGTHYYGKKNLQTRPGVCEFCQRESVLSSYDTRLWFVILHIPIIPLGRKHILNYCSKCRRHRVLALTEWEKLKNQSLSEAMAGMAANPQEPKAAMKAHSALVAFHQTGEADKLTLLLKERFANDAGVQAYLGSMLQYVGKVDESLPYYQRALSLDPELPEAKVAIALNLISKNQLDEAHKLLKFLEAPGQTGYPGALLGLANGYQRAGRHVEALGLYHLLMERVPKLAQDKQFRKSVKLSETAAGNPQTKLPPRQIRRGPIIAVSSIAILLLFIAMFSNYYISQHRTLYLVSGLAQPVTVEIPGHGKTTLYNKGAWTMTLPEGRYQANVTGAVRDTVQFNINSTFWGRWFSKPVYVLNAGGSALLLYQDVTYSTRPTDARGGFRFYFGDSFLTLPNLDYPFTPLPQKITLDSHSSSEQKNHLEPYPSEPKNAFYVLVEKRRFNEAFDLAEWQLRLHPESTELLQAYLNYAIMNKQEARSRAFLAAAVKRRPVELEWHRMYQELRVRNEHEAPQVLAEYEALLQADPTNSTLLYLLGRLQTSKQKAIPLYESALAQNPNNYFAHYALGQSFLEHGDWAKALPHMLEAVRLQPQNVLFQEACFQTRMAAADFTGLEKDLQAKLARLPMDYQYTVQLGQVFIAQDRTNDLQKLLAKFEKGAPAEFADNAEQIIMSLRARLLYTAGKFEELQALGSHNRSARSRTPDKFAALVELGRLPEATEALKARNPEESDPFDALALSLAWKQAGDEAKAAETRNQAIAALAGERPDTVLAAAWLKGNQPVPLEKILDLSLTPERKRVLLVALAQLYPQNNTDLLSTARKLNFNRDFPYHLINRLTAPQLSVANPAK